MIVSKSLQKAQRAKEAHKLITANILFGALCVRPLATG